MSEKEFMIRAQKIVLKAVQSKSNIECSIRRFDDGVLSFDITHFDKRYGPDDNPHHNRSMTAYSQFSDVNKKLNAIEYFVDKLLAGEDALIEEN